MSWSEKISAGEWPATIQSVAGTVVIAVFVVTFLAQAFTIPSESMEQTLLIGDYLLADKFCYGGSRGWNRLMPYRNVPRGDVIVFHYPVNPAQDFVKRVVARRAWGEPAPTPLPQRPARRCHCLPLSCESSAGLREASGGVAGRSPAP